MSVLSLSRDPSQGFRSSPFRPTTTDPLTDRARVRALILLWSLPILHFLRLPRRRPFRVHACSLGEFVFHLVRIGYMFAVAGIGGTFMSFTELLKWWSPGRVYATRARCRSGRLRSSYCR